MRFDIVTLFPEMFEPFFKAGVLGRAVQAGQIQYRLVSPRSFALDRHGSVDDTPYGGGGGMLMMPTPVADALDHLDESGTEPKGRRVLLTPAGTLFTHDDARRFASIEAVTLVCGRYEGVDERVRKIVDEEVSIGDFVLFGGEVAAMAIVEATSRHVRGVLGNPESLIEESHTAGTLEYPHYTRPRVFRGMEVPAILTSGDHAAVARWRRKEALRKTKVRRPDLLVLLDLSDEDRALLSEIENEPEKP